MIISIMGSLLLPGVFDEIKLCIWALHMTGLKEGWVYRSLNYYREQGVC